MLLIAELLDSTELSRVCGLGIKQSAIGPEPVRTVNTLCGTGQSWAVIEIRITLTCILQLSALVMTTQFGVRPANHDIMICAPSHLLMP